MAHKANDGKEFTNKPAMHAHNARMAATKSSPKQPSKASGSSPADTVQCPSCGAKFELHSTESPNTESGMAPGADAAGADGF